MADDDAAAPVELPPAAEGARVVSGRWRVAIIREACTGRGECEPALAALAVAALHLLRRPEPILSLPGSFNDDGVYLVLGRALALGEGYRSIHVPGGPVQLKYPPGLPAVLALLWGLLGELGAVVQAVRALNLVLVAASAALLWWVARRRLALPAPLALLGVLPLALEDTVQYWSLVLGEPWFVLGWAAALAVAARGAADSAPAMDVRRGALLGLTIGVTAIFRTQAAVLLPAFALAAALAARVPGAKRWGAAAACVGAGAVPLLAWSVAQRVLAARGPVSALPDETPYSDWLPLARPAEWLPFALNRVVAADQYYGVALGRMASAGRLAWVVPALLVVLAVAGAVPRWRERLVLSIPAAAALASAIFWPWSQSRLVLPVLPALALLVALALADVGRRLPPMARRAGAALVLALAALLLARQTAIRREGLVYAREGGGPSVHLAADVLPLQSRLVAQNASWVEANTRPDEIVLVDVPAAVWLWTGRRALSSSPAESEAARSVFAVAGRFLAARVVRDGVAVVSTSFPDQPIAHDVRAVATTCPGAVVQVGAAPPTGFPAWFRVNGAHACVRRLAGEAAP